MTENKKDAKLLDHNYDGIQEFDNLLPNWWLATFYGAIIFGIFYVGYYEFGPGPSSMQTLKQDLAQNAELQKRSQQVAGPSESELLAIFNDHEKREAGAAVFKEKCVACHGAHAEGQIGPNLTDKFWIHGDGSLSAILTVVSDGVADKGMPPWKTMLKREEILDVVAYVKSLKGSNPANPKAPQGNEVKEL
ncbi:MAG: cbb3-type cytochrome c oxidase N-terminal domain-containing protein [Bdellovibrionota bacterium]